MPTDWRSIFRVYDPEKARSKKYWLKLIPAQDGIDLIAVDEEGNHVDRILHVSASGVYREAVLNKSVAEFFQFKLGEDEEVIDAGTC